jgi:hypothetical protein
MLYRYFYNALFAGSWLSFEGRQEFGCLCNSIHIKVTNVYENEAPDNSSIKYGGEKASKPFLPIQDVSVTAAYMSSREY